MTLLSVEKVAFGEATLLVIVIPLVSHTEFIQRMISSEASVLSITQAEEVCTPLQNPPPPKDQEGCPPLEFHLVHNYFNPQRTLMDCDVSITSGSIRLQEMVRDRAASEKV